MLKNKFSTLLLLILFSFQALALDEASLPDEVDDEASADSTNDDSSVGDEPSILDKIFGSSTTNDDSLINDDEIDVNNLEIRVEDAPKSGSFRGGANIRIIDKTLGKLYEYEISSGTKKSLKELSVKVIRCWSPDYKTVTPEGKVLLEIFETVNQKNFRIFYGWMFAQSPSASQMPHIKYDVTLGSCFNKAKSDASTDEPQIEPTTEVKAQ